LTLIGMNLTFGPMHVLGLQGQPRRMYVWTDERSGEGFFNLAFWNRVSTVGAFVMAIGILLFFVNVVVTARRRQPMPLDPWDARTLEWMTTNPPPPHNWDRVPRVQHLDEFFHRKYASAGIDADRDLVQVASAEEVLAAEQASADGAIHLPSPSYWPLVAACSLPFIAYGIIFQLWLTVVGVVGLLGAVFGWALEPSVAPAARPQPALSSSVPEARVAPDAPET
jgi:cytochrome c oxidase subunit 1